MQIVKGRNGYLHKKYPKTNATKKRSNFLKFMLDIMY